MRRTSQRNFMRYVIFILIVAALAMATIFLREVSLDIPKIPLGRGVESALDWAIIYLSPALEAIKLGITRVFVVVEAFFLWVPWPVWVVFMGLLAWRLASLGTGLLVGGGLVIIELVKLWDEAMSTVALVGTAVLFAIILAIPIGILASRSNRFDALLRPILDAMQTIPAFVYLIPVVMLLGVGKVPAILATMVFGISPAIRLTNLGLRQVPADVKEAARAFGASGWQMLVKVEIPLSLRTIMAGVNQSTMLSVSMIIIAAFIGAGGLGYSVLFALNRVKVGAGFEAGLAILVIAIVLDRLTQALAKPREPGGIRSANKPG